MPGKGHAGGGVKARGLQGFKTARLQKLVLRPPSLPRLYSPHPTPSSAGSGCPPVLAGTSKPPSPQAALPVQPRPHPECQPSFVPKLGAGVSAAGPGTYFSGCCPTSSSPGSHDPAFPGRPVEWSQSCLKPKWPLDGLSTWPGVPEHQ